MNTTIRKSFYLVEGGKVTPAAQDTQFDGMDSVLVFARTSIEAALIAKAYEDLLIDVDNVTCDNGETASAVSMSDDQLSKLIQSYSDSDDPLIAEALRLADLQSTKIRPEINYANEHPWATVRTADGQHSVEVSLSSLNYDEDGKVYLLGFCTPKGEPTCETRELRMYLEA